MTTIREIPISHCLVIAGQTHGVQVRKELLVLTLWDLLYHLFLLISCKNYLDLKSIIPLYLDLSDFVATWQVNSAIQAISLLSLGIFVVPQRVPGQHKPMLLPVLVNRDDSNITTIFFFRQNNFNNGCVHSQIGQCPFCSSKAQFFKHTALGCSKCNRVKLLVEQLTTCRLL